MKCRVRRKQISKLENDRDKQSTFQKRKRGVIKKAIELSMLCEQHIYLVIFDEQKQRMVEYSSHPKFHAKVVQRLVDPLLPSRMTHERYTNDDLEALQCPNFKGMQQEEEKYHITLKKLVSFAD